MDNINPDPRKVKKGDALTANMWNSVVEAASPRGRTHSLISRLRSMLCYNDTGALIPSYSAFTFDVSGAGGDTVEPTIYAQKGPGDILFTNGQQAIADESYGRCYIISTEIPTKIQTDGSLSTIGEVCGPTTSLWTASSAGTGLLTLSTEGATNLVWAVAQGGGGGDGAYILLGKTSTSITARSGTTPGQGSVDEYTKVSGVLTDSGENYTVFNKYAATVASGTYVGFMEHADGTFWLVGADCP